MKFKLSKLNLFLIIIVVLVLSTLGFNMREYFNNRETPGRLALSSAKNRRTGPTRLASLAYGDKYDPYENRAVDPLLDNDYSKTIAGLEDEIVSGRGDKEKMADIKLAKSAGIDLSKYVLKSEIVPPVCPKCPDSRSCPRPKPCPPCAPCARCPEPAFECKKVPNYNAMQIGGTGAGGTGPVDSGLNGGGGAGGARGAIDTNLPMPQLNSFANFN